MSSDEGSAYSIEVVVVGEGTSAPPPTPVNPAAEESGITGLLEEAQQFLETGSILFGSDVGSEH